jgi:hypothetical protein
VRKLCFRLSGAGNRPKIDATDGSIIALNYGISPDAFSMVSRPLQILSFPELQ